jgi:hypothetical protein
MTPEQIVAGIEAALHQRRVTEAGGGHFRVHVVCRSESRTGSRPLAPAHDDLRTVLQKFDARDNEFAKPLCSYRMMLERRLRRRNPGGRPIWLSRPDRGRARIQPLEAIDQPITLRECGGGACGRIGVI